MKIPTFTEVNSTLYSETRPNRRITVRAINALGDASPVHDETSRMQPAGRSVTYGADFGHTGPMPMRHDLLDVPLRAESGWLKHTGNHFVQAISRKV
jgi:hypothetical protein